MSRTAEIGPARGGASMMVAWRLQDRRVVVFGGGNVAAGRVRQALEADAHVVVVAPALAPELRHRWNAGEVDWRPATYHPADLDGADLVLSCLDDPDVSARIAADARALRIPINCADLPDLCDFWFASRHREGPLQLALSTNGQGPALGARLTREIAAALPAHVEEALERFGDLRQRVRSADPASDASPRRMGWLTRLARSWPWHALAALDDAAMDDLVREYLRQVPPPLPPARPPPRTGRVQLVGAGPGDPRLLTVAARDALEQADLVLADRLVPTAITDLVRGELRIARKHPGNAQAAQDQLDGWLVDAAKQGRHVVRLKCGDPFVFGRGGEELAVLARHGLTAEVVPGVTAALAAPLAAAIPTTLRGVADRFVVLTAQGRDGSRPELPSYQAHTTFVWLMGVRRLDQLTAELPQHGFPAELPVAIVERATHPDERVTVGTIATIHARASAVGVRAPATLIMGWVVASCPSWSADAARPVRSEAVA